VYLPSRHIPGGHLLEDIMSKKIKLYILALLISILSVLALPVKADENQWSSNGPYGGSVLTIAIHPFDNQVIYIGTVENGIYKTTDGGENWNHIDNGGLFSTMRVVAIHPFAPDTLYAASTDGMFKSTNASADWAMLYPPQYPQNPIRAFLIHPTEPNLLFAGGPANEWISTNSGQTWQQLNIPHGVGIADLAVDPSNPDIVYSLSNTMEYGNGIYKSEDRGWTWNCIQNDIADSTGWGTDIEVDPVDTDILYISRLCDIDISSKCLSKSTDGGQSWLDITPSSLSIPYIKSVAVSPFNHNDVFICTKEDGVFKSSDGGETWNAKNNGLRIHLTDNLEIDTANSNMFLGTYKDGIYKSTDEGESWQKISQNIKASRCTDLAVSPHQSSAAFVTAWNGLYRTSDGGLSWNYIEVDSNYCQFPTTVKVDEFLPQNLYLGAFPSYNNIGVVAGFYRSTNNGNSWQFFNDGLPSDNGYVDMAVSYLNENDKRIFLTSWFGVYRSDDVGETWTQCTNGLPTGLYFDDVEIAPGNPNFVITGDDICRVFLSTDRGETWTQAEDLPSPLENWGIQDIEFHPDDPHHIYVAVYFSGLFESTDFGENWICINNNIPIDDPERIVISGITINPQNPLNMFVASNHMGVYQSHNGGQSWEPFNAGLDTTSTVGFISFVPGDTTTLYFASHDRSVWSINRTPTGIETEDLLLPDEISLSSYPNPFNAQTKIAYYIPESGNVSIAIYNINGQAVDTICDSYMSAGNHVITWDASKFASGIYFCTVKTDNKSKSNALVLLK